MPSSNWRTKCFYGTNREKHGIIEHDCLEPDCLSSWDRMHHQYDTECIDCGSTNIVTREGFDMNYKTFNAEGDYRNDISGGYSEFPTTFSHGFSGQRDHW